MTKIRYVYNEQHNKVHDEGRAELVYNNLADSLRYYMRRLGAGRITDLSLIPAPQHICLIL